MASYYSEHARDLKHELAAAIDRTELRALHRVQPHRHFLILARQLLILAACTVGLIYLKNPLLWIPLALAQGFTVFNFTVLLHEVVHNTVFVPGKNSPAAGTAYIMNVTIFYINMDTGETGYMSDGVITGISV